jgi:O-antigen ligase
MSVASSLRLAPARGPSAVALGAGIALLATAITLAVGTLALAVPLIAAAIYVLVRHPPVLLALFIFVPYFESAPGVRAIPVDPTAALAALVLAVCAFRVLRGGFRTPPLGFLVPLGIIGVVLLLGLADTPDPAYGREKTEKFFTVTLLAALAPFVLLNSEQALRRFLWAIVAGAIVVAALTPVLEPTVAQGIATEFDTKGRYSFGGQIFPARFLCTGALILFLVPGLLTGRRRFLALPAAVGISVVALGFGARGPVAAFAATLVAVAAISALRSPRQLATVLVAVAAAAAALPFVAVPGSAAGRLARAANEPVATLRDDNRYLLYEQALQLFRQDPLTGAGTGAYAAYSGIVSPPRQLLRYPHNIFLELGAENGLVPVLAFLFMVVGGVAALMRRVIAADDREKRQLLTILLGLFIFNFLSTQVSGDLNDNRTTLTALAIAWMVGRDGLQDEARAGTGAG